MVSIFDSIKTQLGYSPENTSFDSEIMLYINGALMVMTQLGVGPYNGFLITSKNETWDQFIGDRKDLELVKTDVYLRVKVLFDPPQNPSVLQSMKEEIKQNDWRIEWQVKNPIPIETQQEVEEV
jgi:hypothetical protein